MKFPSQCPECNGETFREVGTTTYQQKFFVDENGEINPMSWGKREDFPESDNPTHYECADCMYVLHTVEES